MKSGFLVLGISSIFLGACTMVNPDEIDKQDPQRFSKLDATTTANPIVAAAVATTEATPEVTPVVAPAPVKKKIRAIAAAPAPAAATAPEQVAVAITPPAPAPEAAIITAPPQPAAVLSNWQPNEAYLFRGRELIAGLQRDIGRQPTTNEMQQRIQSHMGLSAVQAEKLIVALGFN